MVKSSAVYVCSECGHEHVRWQGKCDSCGAWNTLQEFKIGKAISKVGSKHHLDQIVELKDIINTSIERVTTGINEIDRVFGGGFVPGSLILLSGEPGIGKSTLLLQVIQALSDKKKVLYWSAEESADQIAARANRLNINKSNLKIISTTDASILDSVGEVDIMVVDSIQTVADPDIPAPAGSISQVRSVLQSIQIWAKENSRIVIVVGHVTKEGVVAGPKTLEHLVDVVTVLEGDPNYDIRLLRGSKNRFGPTNEVGVFSMEAKGLLPVTNPSKLFLQERLASTPGSVVAVTLEGTRPFLIEVQALVTKSFLTFPRRTASGIDSKRLDLIIAILENRANLKLYNQDIFVNVVGGMKIIEPAVDVAIALSITSAFWNIPTPENWCMYGEIGLGGEIRSVKSDQIRFKEAKRLGFDPIPKMRTILECINLLKKGKIKV